MERPEPRPPAWMLDRRAAQKARAQHGAISHRQALAIGLTEDQIEWRRRSGRWRSPARQVHVMAGVADGPVLRAMVAVLAGPTGAVASHLTAAALLGVAKFPDVPHVTVPPGASARSPIAVVHRAPLDPVDVCLALRIPATRPARTLVDCAGTLGHEALCELVDQTLFRFGDARQVRVAMGRAGRGPGRRGFRNLEQALVVWTPGPKPGSPAEMRLIRHLHRLGFPLPERQWTVRDERGRFVARIDVAWPPWKVGCEYDGKEHHGPRRWEADRERQAKLEALGWQIGRAGNEDLPPGSDALEAWLAPRLPRSHAA